MKPYSLYICEKVIRVEEEIGSFIKRCRGYIVKEPAPEADYCIVITKEEIDMQRTISGPWSKDDLCGFVLLRKLAKLLLKDERTIFVHGSVVAYQGSAFMFTAPSETGKTTHSLLWTKHLPNAYILNGDKPFISTGDQVIAWGAPWTGFEQYNRNEGKVLKAICFLERAEKNRIVEISDDEALAMLSHQIGDPDPSDFHTKIWMMEGLERLRGRVKFYRYEMNNFKEEEAFHTTYDVLSKL